MFLTYDIDGLKRTLVTNCSKCRVDVNTPLAAVTSLAV